MPSKGLSLRTPIAAVSCCLFLFSSSASAKELMDCVQIVNHKFDGQVITEEEKYQVLLQGLTEDQIRFEKCLKGGLGDAGSGADSGFVDSRSDTGGKGGSSGESLEGDQLAGQSAAGNQTFAAALESVSASEDKGTELQSLSSVGSGTDSGFVDSRSDTGGKGGSSGESLDGGQLADQSAAGSQTFAAALESVSASGDQGTELQSLSSAGSGAGSGFVGSWSDTGGKGGSSGESLDGGQLAGQSAAGSQTFASALESVSASGDQGTELQSLSSAGSGAGSGFVGSWSNAQNSMECVQSVDHSFEGQLLTDEEKYQILLRRLADDQIRFEECLQINTSTAGDGGGASGGGSGGSNSSATAGGSQLKGQSTDGSQTLAATLESISASGVQGTELPEPENQMTGLDDPVNEPAGLSDFENQDGLSPAILNEITPGGVASSGNRVLSNGMQPEELEVSDNDAILLNQILAAAKAEQDPDKKKKLMEEYRRMRSGNSGETAVAAGGQQ